MLSLNLKPPVQSVAVIPQWLDLETASTLSPSAIPLLRQPWDLANPVQLNFSELRSFEVVRDQYQEWGIEFEETIALQPSNAAFADPKQPMGLMPIAHPQMMIQFHQARQFIKATLVGARAIIVTAFDANDQVVIEKYLDCQFEPIMAELEPMVPLHALHLQAENIARIEITSAAPFMLQSLCCI